MKPAFAHIKTDARYANLGDTASNPAQYFPEYADCQVVGLNDVAGLPAGQPVVLGGGGILAFPEFIRQTAKTRPTIVWGGGLNNAPDFDQQDLAAALTGCELVGIRDRRFAERHGFQYVPCASVMHPAFDDWRHAFSKHDVLIYQHSWESQIPPVGALRLSNMDRAGSVKDTIITICCSRTVVTNSYHGAYWAQVAGKRVILWKPRGIRFLSGLPYVPAIVHTEEELQTALDFSPTTAKLIHMDCWSRNQEFRDRVNNIL